MTSTELPEKYLEGIRLFNAGEYYDAHEEWEEHWMDLGDSSKDFYKALIQYAVACMHWERGNIHGARKLSRTAAGYAEKYEPAFMQLDVAVFRATMAAYFEPLHAAVAAQQTPPPPGQPRPQIELSGPR